MFVCLGKLKYYVSRTHTHTHVYRKKQANGLHRAHLQHNSLSSTHARSLSTPGDSDVSYKRPAQWGKKCLDKHTRTHTDTQRSVFNPQCWLCIPFQKPSICTLAKRRSACLLNTIRKRGWEVSGAQWCQRRAVTPLRAPGFLDTSEPNDHTITVNH